MEISVRSGNVLHQVSDLGILATFEDSALPDEVAGLLEPNDFRGRAGQAVLLYPRGALAPRRLLLVGLGKREAVTTESARRAAAEAVRRARELQVAALSIGAVDDLPLDVTAVGQAFAEGLALGAYRYWKYRTGLTNEQTFAVERATIYTGDERAADLGDGVATGQAVARGVAFARDLVNSPGYAMTPARMGEEALALGERLGLKVTVLDKAQLTEQGFGGILAVGQGSANDPRFIVMEHGAAGDGPTICLVGKGLTFDSGGLSIKPAEAMDTMKSDMGGAAAVFGAMQVAAELKLPLHVVGLVSSAENMPSATAYRPGDVVTTLSGKTIEVLNTDAEGRIILSDALFYAQRYSPAAIVELSTLTGAIVIALGSHATGLMATDQALADRVSQAGEISGERVWQLPMWQEYHDMIKSEIADLKNIGGRAGGSITAGAFLAAFVGDYPFVHLDIAGTAWADRPTKPYEAQGGTGVGVRLLAEFLRGYSQ
jgi:leucyl aminopeptidase